MPISIIVAFTHKTFGIGKDGKLPWDIPEDLANFAKVTRNKTVIFGKNTYLSIPEDKRPLKNRKNIVVSTSHRDNKLTVMNISDCEAYIEANPSEEIFICGGEELYKHYAKKAEYIYATIIEKEYDCDKYFKISNFDEFIIDTYSMQKVYNGLKFRYITYRRSSIIHQENIYLDLVKDVMNNGNYVLDRTNIGCYSVFGRQLRFDISKSIPLLTSKFVSWQLTIKELLFFLRGQTDTKLLEDQGVYIWSKNTTREFLDKQGLSHYREKDMGKMYGFNWRHYNAEYKGCDDNYDGKGYDQLENVLINLKKDPFSRRHVFTAFNPADASEGVLYCCHSCFVQLHVTEDNNKQKYLSIMMTQRSADTFLGLPYNIASYAILCHIIGKMCGYKPKELVISIGDCHIYSNHMEQCRIQLNKYLYPFPVIEISDSVKDKKFEDIVLDDFKMVGYLHNEKIQAEMAV